MLTNEITIFVHWLKKVASSAEEGGSSSGGFSMRGGGGGGGATTAWTALCWSNTADDLTRSVRRFIRKAMLFRITDWLKYMLLLMFFSVAMNVM